MASGTFTRKDVGSKETETPGQQLEGYDATGGSSGSGGCCTGSELNMRSFKTPGQNQMGEMLGPLLAQGMRQGATPFTGQLSAGPDQAQMAAMQAMMGIGGQGQYQQQAYPMMGAPGQPGPNIPEWNYDYVTPGGGLGGGTDDVITPGMLKDPNNPATHITPDMLRDPGHRNNVPPGSDRNIAGGTSTMTPEELAKWRRMQHGAYSSGGTIPDPYSSYRIRP